MKKKIKEDITILLSILIIKQTNFVGKKSGLLDYGNIRVVKFSNRGYKIGKICAQKLTYPQEIMNLKNWCNEEVSKIGHHFL